MTSEKIFYNITLNVCGDKKNICDFTIICNTFYVGLGIYPSGTTVQAPLYVFNI